MSILVMRGMQGRQKVCCITKCQNVKITSIISKIPTIIYFILLYIVKQSLLSALHLHIDKLHLRQYTKEQRLLCIKAPFTHEYDPAKFNFHCLSCVSLSK